MMTLFDDEYIMKTYLYNKIKEASEEAAEKAAKKAAKEASEKAAKESAMHSAEKMLRANKLSPEEIASYFDELSLEDVLRIKEKIMQAV